MERTVGDQRPFPTSAASDRLPSLTALRCFEAAARHLHFGAAGIELALTRSAISHQVKRLEQELGRALFRREGRTLSLTPAGELLLPVVSDAFAQIRTGARLLRGANDDSGAELTLQVYITTAVKWLLPHLQSFSDQHPQLSLRLHTSVLEWRFDAEQADVGLVYLREREPREPSLSYQYLFRAQIFPVCSPALLHGERAIRQPADLINHELIEVYTDHDSWRAWLAAAQLAPLAKRRAMQMDTYLLAYQSAVDGFGVAIGNGPFVAADLQSGRLAQPFTLTVAEPGAWYLVYRKTLRDDPRIEKLQYWLRQLIADDALLQPFIDSGCR